MFSLKARLAALAGLTLPLALLGTATPAHAIVETSQITSPSDLSYLFDESALAPTFTVTGTADVAEVEIRCYYGPGLSAYSEINKGKKEEKVSVTGGSFSVLEPVGTLPSQPCVLRAVPAGNKEEHPPGASSPFMGPRVVRSLYGVSTKSGVTYNYNQESVTLAAYLGIESVGEEGLYFSYLFAPGTLVKSESGFYDNASLTGENQPPSGSSTRSELVIDGANAYSPSAALRLGEKLVKEVLPGTPAVAESTPIETAPGEFTLHESDPIVKCAPEPSVFPPTAASCKEFVSTGVQLNRTWQATHGDRVALLSDVWSSTDGHAHGLDALYYQEPSEHGAEGAFEFPGSSSFSAVSSGQSVTLPAGAGAIYYKTDAATPEGGDLENPQLAIVYDSAPDGSPAFHKGSSKGRPDFEMHYTRTIPAGGAYTLRMGFVTEYSLGAVKALAGEALASYPPTLSIASPANGAVVSAPSVTVTGSVADTGALSSVTVNGHAAAVAANGSWSVSVPLTTLGANTLTAVATDQVGLSSSKAVTVAYAPPVGAKLVGSVSASKGRVSFEVACSGVAGQSCEILATLTTLEKLRGSKLLAVSAKRRKHPKTRSKTVTVGTTTVTIPAGKTATITIKLNSIGSKLLARYHKLPVHLSAVLVTGATKSTVIAQNLTVKSKPKRKHKHKRKR